MTTRVPLIGGIVLSAIALSLSAADSPPERPRLRSSDEIEYFGSFGCHRSNECWDAMRALDEEDDRSWRHCASHCGIRSCGTPALAITVSWLLAEGLAIDDEVVVETIDTYDLHRARRILREAHAARFEALEACRPARPPGQVAPTDHYAQLADLLYTHLAFVIAADGSLAGIGVDENALMQHPATAGCIAGVFRDLEFPPSIQGETLEVHHQVYFAPRPSYRHP